MKNNRLTRRELLSRGAGAVLVAGAAAAGGYLLHDAKGHAHLDASARGGGAVGARRIRNFFAAVDYPDASPRISVALGDEQGIERMMRAAVGGLDPALGMRRFIRAGDVVLIKPNVGFDRPPQLGATTHPEVVRWAIRLCREAGAGRILVADNPIEAPDVCFAKSGIGPVAVEEGAEVVRPAQELFEPISVRDVSPGLPGGVVLARWPVLYPPLAEATRVIGVAPVKDHNLCGGSMSLKNWYGLLGGRRNQLHQSIHEAISDLALLISPTLVIADATRVMMRNGPTGGRISDVRPGGELGRCAVIAAVDPVACDAWCYQNLLGRDPGQLTYLALAQQKIQAQIAAGERRFGQSDWHVYERQGKVVRGNV